MKKIKLILFATLIAALFTACNTKKDNATEAVKEEVSVKEEAKATTSGSSIIDQYQALCDKMVELNKKVQAGETSAIQDYQKIAQEYASFAQENQDAWSKLSAEEIQKIQDIGTKAAAALQQQ